MGQVEEFVAQHKAWGGGVLAPVLVVAHRCGIATELGERFAVRSTVVNRGGQPVRGAIAHLNVLSLRPGLYVDPEDWSSERTRYLGTIPAGGSRSVTWRLQAVAPGRLGVYVAVLSDGRGAPVTAPVVEVAVTERRKLNAGGVVPVALGVPGLLALLAVGAALRRHH